LQVGERLFLADIVLLASRVKPEIFLAMDAGIEIGKAGGMVVNEMLQVKVGKEFLPNVYAGGECVEVKDFITGEARISQLGTAAWNMVYVIGNNITGKHTAFGPLADLWVAVVGDLQFGGVGITSKKAESKGMSLVTGFFSRYTRASYYPDKKNLYIKLPFKDDCLVGAQLVGGEGIKERIDALSLTIRMKSTIKDLQTWKPVTLPQFQCL
jgi:NADH oxidase (H2O2-forming)